MERRRNSLVLKPTCLHLEDVAENVALRRSAFSFLLHLLIQTKILKYETEQWLGDIFKESLIEITL